uniref:Uncharacterized protein n=1 Tax=Gokushovirinae environmental samples TaxID=1478972 RepID=A0A2R3UAN2_9VIRU|nr:hypothetical protein [Gokushovirinae environmental samples]
MNWIADQVELAARHIDNLVWRIHEKTNRWRWARHLKQLLK